MLTQRFLSILMMQDDLKQTRTQTLKADQLSNFSKYFPRSDTEERYRWLIKPLANIVGSEVLELYQQVFRMSDCVFVLLVPAGHESHETRVRPSSSFDAIRSERNTRLLRTMMSNPPPSSRVCRKESRNSLAGFLRRERN